MQRYVVIAAACTVLSLVAGCGGGSTSLSLQEQFDKDSGSAEAMAARLVERSKSPFDIFANAGVVTYNGYAVVGVDTADQSTELLGETTIVADFDTSVVTGTMGNFVGAAAPLTQTETPAVAVYSGTLTLANGLVDGLNRPNQFGADFSGTLTGQGNVITLDGALIGDFKGGPLRNGIVGVSTDAVTTTTLNGIAAEGVVGIIAEADRQF